MSDAAYYLAGTKAAGAYVHFPRNAVFDNGNSLNVRRPFSFGLPVGVADQITGHGSFFTNLAILSHSSHLLAVCSAAENQTKVFYHGTFSFASTK
jgi:hypothetical protein